MWLSSSWLDDVNWMIRIVNPQSRKSMNDYLSKLEFIVWLELPKRFLEVSSLEPKALMS